MSGAPGPATKSIAPESGASAPMTAPAAPAGAPVTAAAPHAGVALEEQTHPMLGRIAHWGMAASIILLIGSGWRIYDNAPIFPFHFPMWVSLGGSANKATITSNDWGTGNAIAWHFAAMWGLLLSFLLFLTNGLLTGHFRRDFLPVGPKSFLRDFIAAATFRLPHRLGEYNAVQRAFYWGVMCAVTLMLVSGLAIWKPVQFGFLTWLFGGFPGARVVHFLGMSALAGFLVIHIVLVALVPKTLQAMVTGRATQLPHGVQP